jgi:hypothetical protein
MAFSDEIVIDDKKSDQQDAPGEILKNDCRDAQKKHVRPVEMTAR